VSQFDLSDVSHKATKRLQSIKISLCALCPPTKERGGENIKTETLLKIAELNYQRPSLSVVFETFKASTIRIARTFKVAPESQTQEQL